METDKSAKQRKEATEKLREIEAQLEWTKAEKDEALAKHQSEKKVWQEKVQEAELQLNKLKTNKKDEVKVCKQCWKNTANFFIHLGVIFMLTSSETHEGKDCIDGEIKNC